MINLQARGDDLFAAHDSSDDDSDDERHHLDVNLIPSFGFRRRNIGSNIRRAVSFNSWEDSRQDANETANAFLDDL